VVDERSSFHPDERKYRRLSALAPELTEDPLALPASTYDRPLSTLSVTRRKRRKDDPAKTSGLRNHDTVVRRKLSNTGFAGLHFLSPPI